MITFYDNGGETIDRYKMYVKEDDLYTCYGFSMNAMEEWGHDEFSHISENDGTHHREETGEPIDWDKLPLSVQVACLQRLDPRNN